MIGRWVRFALVALVVWVLLGCARDVLMLNPRTGETTSCPASAGGVNPWSQQEACIAGHIAGGWIRAEPE